jgi:UPF0176 protein
MTGKTATEAPLTVAALYRFARLENYVALRQQLLDLCNSHGIRGTLLLAHEGINGTVAGSGEAIAALVAWLRSMPALDGIDVKYSQVAHMPFHRMKVRLKKEIVTMGVGDIDPSRSAGCYVDAKDWNALICDPDTVVIDTRNDYEVKLGTFRNAVNPQTQTFREFPQWADNQRGTLEGRKVAMFCTGGIRCEKATAYVKSLGVEDVFHLKGGILKYLEEVAPENSLWDGECFVFDERVSVGHDLVEGEAVLCRACRTPLTAAEIEHPAYEEGVSCPHCIDERSDADRARYAERHRQVHLHEKRGTKPHIGG